MRGPLPQRGPLSIKPPPLPSPQVRSTMTGREGPVKTYTALPPIPWKSMKIFPSTSLYISPYSTFCGPSPLHLHPLVVDQKLGWLVILRPVIFHNFKGYDTANNVL